MKVIVKEENKEVAYINFSDLENLLNYSNKLEDDIYDEICYILYEDREIQEEFNAKCIYKKISIPRVVEFLKNTNLLVDYNDTINLSTNEKDTKIFKCLVAINKLESAKELYDLSIEDLASICTMQEVVKNKCKDMFLNRDIDFLSVIEISSDIKIKNKVVCN